MTDNHRLMEDLKVGKRITLLDAEGKAGCFHLNIGDALLNGNPNQVWLCDDQAQQPLYLRRLPEKPMTVGIALFSSLDELSETLVTGRYYIG